MNPWEIARNARVFLASLLWGGGPAPAETPRPEAPAYAAFEPLQVADPLPEARNDQGVPDDPAPAPGRGAAPPDPPVSPSPQATSPSVYPSPQADARYLAAPVATTPLGATYFPAPPVGAAYVAPRAYPMAYRYFPATTYTSAPCVSGTCPR